MHRHEAFQSAEFLMDYLKSRAPFWKKEVTKDGYHWVEPIVDDEKALERW
jgi:molybdopterin synthase catalytic subunit